MANYLDQMGDMIRGLMRSGMSEDAAIAAARAAQNAPPAPVRQMELPIGDNAPDWSGVVRHVDSEGFPQIYRDNWPITNGVSGQPVRRSAALQRRVDAANGIGAPDFSRIDSAVPTAPDMDLGSDLWHQMDKSARGYENIVKGRTGNLRHQNSDLARIAQQNIQGQNAAAAAQRAAATQPSGAMDLAMDIAVPAALVGGAGLAASQMGSPQPPAAEATTADLAAESRPVPAVAATDADGIPTDEAAFTEMFKRQYQAREDKRQQRGAGGYADPSDKAKAILEDLNARRRQAGSEVPEAAQMMADANRLIAMGNEQRNAPGYTPRKASDPREQAQILLQKLNADRMEAGGEVPHSQQVMAEVRRLQAMGDQQRWPSR